MKPGSAGFSTSGVTSTERRSAHCGGAIGASALTGRATTSNTMAAPAAAAAVAPRLRLTRLLRVMARKRTPMSREGTWDLGPTEAQTQPAKSKPL